MKLKANNLIVMLFLVCFGVFAQEDTKDEVKDDSENLMTQVDNYKSKMLEKDPSLSSVLDDAQGYVIFPDIDEAGFVVGGSYGEGAVYENGVFIGTATLKQLDIGLQAGFESFAEIIVFKDQETLDAFKNDKFEPSAELSAVVLDKGAAKSVTFDNGIAAFVMPKNGIMADASVGAQRFSFTKKTDTRVGDF